MVKQYVVVHLQLINDVVSVYGVNVQDVELKTVRAVMKMEMRKAVITMVQKIQNHVIVASVHVVDLVMVLIMDQVEEVIVAVDQNVMVNQVMLMNLVKLTKMPVIMGDVKEIPEIMGADASIVEISVAVVEDARAILREAKVMVKIRTTMKMDLANVVVVIHVFDVTVVQIQIVMIR